jgi:hypothetical protein
MTTPAPAPVDSRVCEYCGEPAAGMTVRHRPGDPTSPRVALGHNACYRRFMADAPRTTPLVDSGQPSRIEPGRCECGRWSEYCRVVAEIDGDSGPGYVVLCCPVCDLEPAPKRRRASEPRRYPG